MDALILLLTLGVMLAIGVPVAYAVGLSALAGAWWIDLPLEALMIQLTNGVNKFSLLAIPFFILAAAIMAEGGIARRLVSFAYIFVGFIRGSARSEHVAHRVHIDAEELRLCPTATGRRIHHA